MEQSTQKEKIEKINGQEEEKLKLLNQKKYTDKEIIYKALNKNMTDWKKIIFKLIDFLFDMIKISLPIYKGKLIDNISSLKSFNESLIDFRNYLLFILLKGILNIVSQMIGVIKSSNDDKNNNKKILLNKIVEKDLHFFEIYKTGELIGKIKDLDNCNLDILSDILQIIRYLFQLFIIGYYLISTSFYLSLVLAIIFFLSTMSRYLLMNSQKLYSSEDFFGKINKYRNKINEIITNIKMIKTFAREKYEINQLDKYRNKIDIKSSLKIFTTLEILSIIEALEYPTLLIFFGKFILEGKITLGTFTVFQQYKNEFQSSYYAIKYNYSDIKRKITAWRKFLELYDFPVKIKSNKDYIPKEIKGKINFENVEFSYPLRPLSKVLNNLSFNIEPGKILAICGFSGSGKTTISNLLERFYDVDKGRIYIDDIDIKDYNIEYLRKMIGFVEQEPVLNSGTVLSNIIYGVDSYEEDDLNEILKMTCVDSFINDKALFPEGLNTLVGERGLRVSGGQKQRIAIARALMKDLKILILDEATSALDGESEAEIHKSIYNLIKKRGITIIIIAHRLSTIINADKIIVINKGKVVEIGNHKELMNKNGEYKKLFDKQIAK